MSTLGEKLSILMENQGWTQARLANELHYTASTVSTWVRNIHQPPLETIQQLCSVFCVSLEELLDDRIEIPRYYFVDRYLPYWMADRPKERRDSEHEIYDAALAGGAFLHRFTNAAGAPCSAIYLHKREVWWHYREREARMIRDWNREYNHDR